ncbi:MAG TPA: hypothetical protein VGF44_12470 [Terriglobales bacterium]|jgi:hypothetical protein
MLSTLFRQVRFVALTGIASFAIVSATYAQGPGVAASVTSHGFGGHAGASGVPASVTAHGSFAPNHPVMMHNPLIVNRGFANQGLNQGFVHRGFGERPGRPTREPRREPRRFRNSFPGTAVYGFPYYPYSYENGDEDYADQSAQNQDDENSQQYYEEQSSDGQTGGPTIFDRRGPGPEYQTWRDQAESDPSATTEVVSEPQPEPAAPPTVLVFKDGHQVEVANYAIVGSMLFDLTPGHPRRVALSELDINATQKQNDDRGVDFKLPTGM